MYIYDRQLTGDARQKEISAILRPSQRFDYTAEALTRHPYLPHVGLPCQLGATVAPPKGLILLDHFHTPKQPDPVNPGRFIPGSATKLDVKDMNPGFIDKNGQLMIDTSINGLQTNLRKLITTQFQNYLSNQRNSAPSAGDRLRVALVDLTGAKISKPDFAGWGSMFSMYGASVPKILAVYAVHQLRRDLRQLAASLSISNGAVLEKAALQNWQRLGLKSGFPNLVWLFDIRKWSGHLNTLNFTNATVHTLDKIKENTEAGDLIIKVGFPYIASVTWQSGLFHPTRKGLWLTSSYGKGRWGNNPVQVLYSANVTALSVATYFTLLAQGRLVDDESSNEIKACLLHGCRTSLFPLSLDLVASKCGIWSDYLHDCALIDRGGVQYVVAGLTRTYLSESAKYSQLFLELDKLIVRNNEMVK